MVIEKEPFRRYKLDEERDPNDITFTIRLTEADKEWFIPAKSFIKQPKTSTAMKQLAQIGAIIVLHDKKIAEILDVISGNSRRNERIGIPESEFSNEKQQQM